MSNILDITEEFETDLQRLNAAAMRNPGGPQEMLLQQTLDRLEEIKNGTRPHHKLDYMPSYPDLSDCFKAHVWSTPDTRTKPSHRLVWRESPAPGGHTLCQPVILGPRENGIVYQKAGQRLGRPVGVTLEQLRREAALVEGRLHQDPVPNRAPSPPPTDQFQP